MEKGLIFLGKILFKASAAGVLLFGMFVLAPAVSANSLDREIAVREQARSELERRIQWHNEAVERISQQERLLRDHLSLLLQNSEITLQQIELMEHELDRLQSSINELDAEMTVMSEQKEILMRALGLRLVNIFKYGSREELNLLLSAESANEAMASAFLLERIARHERFAIEDLLIKVEELERGKRSVEVHRAQLAARTEDLENLREAHIAAIDYTNEQLSVAQRERQRAAVTIREMEQARLEIDRAMAVLLRQRRESMQVALPVSVTPPIFAGREDTVLDWPVRGSVVSHFGPREHADNTRTFNSGIGISAPSGTPVRAAGSGIVLYEGWLQGFGQVVIIDHGRNLSTIYAHLADTQVRERESVTPGTVIGTVGNTGTAEGYSLHFEVRVGDSARNPLDYLRGI